MVKRRPGLLGETFSEQVEQKSCIYRSSLPPQIIQISSRAAWCRRIVTAPVLCISLIWAQRAVLSSREQVAVLSTRELVRFLEIFASLLIARRALRRAILIFELFCSPRSPERKKKQISAQDPSNIGPKSMKHLPQIERKASQDP